MSTFITTTERGGLQAAVIAGNAVYKLLLQVHGIIDMESLGEEYKNLFAEPVENPSSNSIDWYTEADGDVVAVSSLSAQEQAPVYERFTAICGQLHASAQKMREPSGNRTLDAAQRGYADILDKALTAPNGSLYLVGQTIVLTSWGFSLADNDIVKDGEIGKEFVVHNAPPKPEPEPKAPTPKPEFKITPPVQAAVPSQAVQKEAKPEAAPETKKEAAPPAQEEQTPAAPVAQEEQKPAAAPETKKEAAPIPPKSQTKATPPEKKKGPSLLGILLGVLLVLVIAAVAWWYFSEQNKGATPADSPSSKSLAFLDGEHRVKGGLLDDKEEAVQLSLKFAGGQGNGEAIVSTASQTCTGRVQARFLPNGNLIMDMGALSCPNGDDFDPFSLECKHGPEKCTATGSDGARWEMEFARVGGQQ